MNSEKNMRKKLEGLAFVVRNFGDIWELVKIQIKQFTFNAIARFVAFGKNIPIIAQFIFRNWKELFTDLVNIVKVVTTNMAKNFINLGKAIANFLMGEGFEFTFTPLTEGFKSALKEFPKLVAPELVSLEDEMDKVLGRIAGREEKRLEKMAERRRQAARALAGQAGGPTGPQGPAATGPPAAKKIAQQEAAAVRFTGLQEFAKTIQVAAFGRDKDKIAKQQLTVQKDTLTELREIRKAKPPGLTA